MRSGPEDGGDVAVGQRAADDDGVGLGRDDASALEQGAQPLDQIARPFGQVGEGPLLDLSVRAIGFAEQQGGRRVAVGDGLDVHGYEYRTVLSHITTKK